jgi:predicted alpha/beta superfamily hydrolase
VREIIDLEDNRRLRVVLPDGYHRSERQYPVVYVLDERWSLGAVADCAVMLGMQRMMPKVICVGVGYQDETLSEVSERRGGDYTPTDWPFPSFTSIRGTYPSGGAPETIDRLIDETIPLVENRYRVDTTDRVLFGHSLSGLCAAWCFLTRPGTFHRYLLSSPSVWWHDQITLGVALPEINPETRLFVTAGGEERGSPSKVFESAEGFAIRLADAGHRAAFQELPGELHHSTIGAAVSAGLRHLYREQRLPTS